MKTYRSSPPTLATSVLLALIVGLSTTGCSDDASQDPVLVVETPDDDAGEHNDGDELPDGNPDLGTPCTTTEDCAADLECERDALGGVCTITGCGADTCPGGSLCLDFTAGGSACVETCSDASDCHPDMRCEPFDEAGICVPANQINPTASFDHTQELLGVDCDPQPAPGVSDLGENYQFTFTIDDDAASFLMVPFVTRGRVMATSLRTPTATVNLRNDYRHHNTRLTNFMDRGPTDGGTFGEIAFDWPTLVPYGPQFTSMVHPGGQYTVTVGSDRTPPCIYVISGRGGSRLDLNFYFVGLQGLDAKSAQTDTDFQEIITHFNQVYQQAGISLGTLRYFDIPDEIAQSYSMIRSSGAVNELTAFGAPPTDTLDGHLSLDVFLVRDIQMPGADGVLGISPGLPGPVGMHGNIRNGVVFHTADIGRQNKHVAHIMAHEIGHYLGLRHTTEVVHGTSDEAQFDAMIGTTDPIEDTPVCQSVQQFGFSCPDLQNLMFPVAPPPQLNINPQITAGQKSAMQANPFIK